MIWTTNIFHWPIRRSPPPARQESTKLPNLEGELFYLHDIRQPADSIEDIGCQGLIYLQESDSVATLSCPPEMKGRDVDARIAECTSQITDNAGLVVVGDAEHEGRQCRLYPDALHINDAYPTAAK